MTDLSYADWVYEFERVIDLDNDFKSRYYKVARVLLREMYPDFYSRWIREGSYENETV